jgi:triosephosphate isomerase
MYLEAASVCAELGTVTEIEYEYGARNPLPLFHPYEQLESQQRDGFIDFYREVLDAVEGTPGRVLLEPINRSECRYLNLVSDNLAVLEEVDHPNAALLPDTFHMSIEAPFFEIGPKNHLRRHEIESLAIASGAAGAEHGVHVLLTVPTVLVAPTHDLHAGVLVLAQGMDVERPGPSMNRVTAESLVDAGAWGVMLDHDADPLEPDQLDAAISRASEVGLATVVCAATREAAVGAAHLGADVVLFEPPELIGTRTPSARDWIPASTEDIHRARHGVLAMHAGGIATPDIAYAVMAAGADGTGSTSGVLDASRPDRAAHDFIASTRAGWDQAQSRREPTPLATTTAKHTPEETP